MSDTPRRDKLSFSSAGMGAAQECLMWNHEYAKIERELAGHKETLELIRDHGGTTNDEGLTCNGSWCGEQARRRLEEAK